MPNKKRVRLNLEAKVIKFNPNANIKDFNKEPIESISLAEESEAQRPQLHDPKAYTKRGVSVAAP